MMVLGSRPPQKWRESYLKGLNSTLIDIKIKVSRVNFRRVRKTVKSDY